MTDIMDQSFSEMEDMARLQSQGRYAGDKNLRPEFYMKTDAIDLEATKREGRPICTPVEHIRIYIPGLASPGVDKVVTNIERNRFKEYYEKWKAGSEISMTGTPLEMCTWMGPNLVTEMKHFNVRTVEDLAHLADSHIQKFPGLVKYRDIAISYLAQAEKGKAAADLAAAMEQKDAQITDLTELVRGLQQTLQKLQGTVELQATSAPPKPRGRRAATA